MTRHPRLSPIRSTELVTALAWCVLGLLIVVAALKVQL